MEFPMLHAPAASRYTVDVFGGYHHSSRIGDGEFYDMENLTSDHYPVLAPRGGRSVVARPESPAGLIARDALCWVDGERFVINGDPVDMELTPGEKQLVSMGAYVVVFPDKKYVNTLNTREQGSLEACFDTWQEVEVTPCNADGSACHIAARGDSPPDAPTDAMLWLDTGAASPVLKAYSTATESWSAVGATYVKVSSPGIGKDFAQYDGVTVSGFRSTELEHLNGSQILWDRGEDYLVLTGLVGSMCVQFPTQGSVRVERRVPELDFVVESGNRLWGCRYGLDSDGQPVNELYASKLGDFKNWSCFMGVSTDSYRVSLGNDGVFTGAVCYLGQPLFFREACIHRVYGSTPATFQLQTTGCRGVEHGSWKSIAQVGQRLYYKSREGICVYDGGLPAPVSRPLGNVTYHSAVAGALGDKYYVSMRDGEEKPSLFVLDTAKNLWHREDSPQILAICACRDSLYALGEGGIWDLLRGTQPVQWMAQTGPMGIADADMQYISRITVNLRLESGATLRVYARHDGGGWEQLLHCTASQAKSFSVPVRPRRCRTLELRLEGLGDARVYAITRTVEKGSEQA